MIRVTGRLTPGSDRILTPEALAFVERLQRDFGPRRKELLARRAERQKDLDGGRLPEFLPETRHVRQDDWQIESIPDDLQDRRVEITGPPTRKMVINALNSGANVYMADFEDSHSPTWEGTIEGQINLRDAVKGDITFTSPEGKKYELNDKTAALFVRPRGWHLTEKHVLLDGEEISGGILDFGLFFFHNARTLVKKGTGPYFYLPKLESHLEARLWNDIFVRAQKDLGLPPGTIKATVLIETILAAFEMDEILYELRQHSAGLNCGRWDYIFSIIKRLRGHPAFLLPDRAQITMSVHCMRSYSRLLIKTCHRRKAHAMGGMAAQIPIKGDPPANEEAIAKVRADKKREANDGHDGTWVAHPGLVAVAREEFDRVMPQSNQIAKRLEELSISASDLLRVPVGTITEEGFRTNVRVGVRYMEAWLRGNGCVPLYGLMEDAATAEISRTQIWQWIHHPRGVLSDGRQVTLELFRDVLGEEMTRLEADLGSEKFRSGRYGMARQLFEEITSNQELEEFLTLHAYPYID
ncbi:MAG: malate synthase A [Acidobacteria bacterium]|nr:malate synthase A [Acidobacteriota bacterium]